MVLTVACVLLERRFHAALWHSLAITFGTFSYHLIMLLSVGLIFNACMRNHADDSKRWYQQKSFEPKLYERLRVRDWKGSMPTYASDLFDPKKHMDEIAQAMCQAELVHETIALLSFLPIIATCWYGSFPVFLATSFLSALIDLLFVAMQRYNRPRVIRLAKRQSRQKEKVEEK